MIDRWDKYWNKLDERSKTFWDLIAHYLMAFVVLFNLAACTFYIGNICGEMFMYCALLALGIIPLRMLTHHLLCASRNQRYLNQVLQEILYCSEPNQGKPQRSKYEDEEGEDDDNWFLR